jgi:hypothetical protein
MTTAVPARAALLAVAALSLSSMAARAQEAVFVTNFPEVQEITGAVELSEPLPFSESVAFEAVEVTTVSREESTALVAGGVLHAEGFTSVVLSLAGEIKGTLSRPSTLGVLLIPDESFVTTAFREGSYLFPIEIEVDLPSDTGPYVAAKPARHQLAFSSYRIYFYNTGARTVRAQLYALLAK